MKKKNGFTLIELLAVIIILGVLMIIAIPAVTSYIQNSRKSAYIDTGLSYIKAVVNKVNEGKKLQFFTEDILYLVPVGHETGKTCVSIESGGQSPFSGSWNWAYVGVTYKGQENNFYYYYISEDKAGQGIGFHNQKSLNDDGVDDMYTLTKIKEEGYDILKAQYDQQENKIYESGESTSGMFNDTAENTEDYEKLKNILPTDQEYQAIVIVGARDCEFNDVGSSSGETTNPNTVCKPATTLHNTTICNRSDSYGCNATGQAGNGNPITYGTIPNGTPKAGDAYDCKVTKDGDYTERFYYVGSDGANSTLIYYKNMSDQSDYAYDSSNQNNHGPRTAYSALPSTTVWDNPNIISPGTREIKNENNGDSTSGGKIESFSYADRAARFLTSQELVNSCSSISTVRSYTTGGLDGCNWLMENIGQYEGTSWSYGYWLETPRSDYANNVWYVFGNSRSVYHYNASYTPSGGVRPVITVKTSDISK